MEGYYTTLVKASSSVVGLGASEDHQAGFVLSQVAEHFEGGAYPSKTQQGAAELHPPSGLLAQGAAAYHSGPISQP